MNSSKTRSPYPSHDRLVLFDADGTTIDAFEAIGQAFAEHNMDLGDLERFQKRHNIFKYLGGLKEFPLNLKQQIGKQRRKKLIATMTRIYRTEAKLFPGMAELLKALIARKDVRVGLVTRNITNSPEISLSALLARHDIDLRGLDYWEHVPLGQSKTDAFKAARERFGINPARAFVCGDESKDYSSAIAAGMHPLIASYGFESFERLTERHEVPVEVIAQSPDELIARLMHALDLPVPESAHTEKHE